MSKGQEVALSRRSCMELRKKSFDSIRNRMQGTMVAKKVYLTVPTKGLSFALLQCRNTKIDAYVTVLSLESKLSRQSL